METKSKYARSDPNSFWHWKGNTNKKKNNGNQFPVAEFLRENRQKMEEIVYGPGGGMGIGCGVGLGFGLVGGMGYGGWPWNHLKLAFGVGLGCGIGLGFGYGQGIGYGFSLDSLESYISKQSSDSNRRPLIDI